MIHVLSMIFLSVCAIGATHMPRLGKIPLRYTITDAVELAPLPHLVAQYIDSECETDNTRRTYATGLRQFLEWLSNDLDKKEAALSYSDVTRVVIAEYKKYRLKTGKPSTAALRLDTVKAFTAWMSEHYRVDDPGARVAYVPKGEIDFRGLTPKEVRTMLHVARLEPDPVRRFLPCFILFTGLRINCEALSLKAEQVDLGALYIRSVLGKGSKLRHVPIDPEGIPEFARYLNWHEAQRYGRDAMLFPSPHKDAERISYHTGLRAVSRHGHHPHALRHTYAYRFLDREKKEGTDAFRAAIKLKNALGHTDINTTLIYLGIQPGTFEQRSQMEAAG